MRKAHFEVVIRFNMVDEKVCSQKSCDKFLDAFLEIMTDQFSGVKEFAELTDIIVKSGPEDSPEPLYKADIRDYSNKKHFS